MINFELFVFAYLSSSFVMRDINPKSEKNMALHLGRHGVGATFSALIKFIHPSEHIHNKFPNPCSGQRLLDCIPIWQEVKTVSRKEQLTLIVLERYRVLCFYSSVSLIYEMIIPKTNFCCMADPLCVMTLVICLICFHWFVLFLLF